VDGVGFDALHHPIVVMDDHLAGADADAEALEDLVGEALNFGNGGRQGLDSRGIVFIERHRWRRCRAFVGLRAGSANRR